MLKRLWERFVRFRIADKETSRRLDRVDQQLKERGL